MGLDLYQCELKDRINNELENFLILLFKINKEHDEDFLHMFVMNYVEGILSNYFSWLKSDMTNDRHYKELEDSIRKIFEKMEESVIKLVIPSVLKDSKVSSIISNTIH